MRKLTILQKVTLLLLFIFSLVIYSPSVKLHFSLLDDGLTILNARQIIINISNGNLSGLFNIFFEPTNGRVRPGYWLLQSFFAYLSLYNSYVFHILRFGLLVATMHLSYKLLTFLKLKFVAILTALFAFLFNIQNFENYYRLGPVEPFTIFILTSIYLFVFTDRSLKRVYFAYLGIMVFIGGFVKENFFLVGLTLVPTLLIHKFQNNKKQVIKTAYVIGILIITGVLVFLIKSGYPTDGVYASNYELGFNKIYSNFITYIKLINFYQSPLFAVSLVYLIYSLYKFVNKGLKNLLVKDIVYVSLWLQIVIQLLVLSPWTYTLNRYVSFVNISLTIIYAITLSDLFRLLIFKINNVNYFQKTLILATCSIVLSLQPFVRNFFDITNLQLLSAVDSEISYKSVADIAKHIPLNSAVYVNYKKGDVNIEIFEETKWHLRLFQDRADLEFIYLDSENLCSVKDRYIFDRRSDRFLDKSVFENQKVFSLVSKGNSVYAPVNYGVVLKSFRDRHKYKEWNDQYDFDWNIFIQKGGTCIENKTQTN